MELAVRATYLVLFPPFFWECRVDSRSSKINCTCTVVYQLTDNDQPILQYMHRCWVTSESFHGSISSCLLQHHARLSSTYSSLCYWRKQTSQDYCINGSSVSHWQCEGSSHCAKATYASAAKTPTTRKSEGNPIASRTFPPAARSKSQTS